jgi:AefR-like transcriptional repressor, C-terminal domain
MRTKKSPPAHVSRWRNQGARPRVADRRLAARLFFGGISLVVPRRQRIAGAHNAVLEAQALGNGRRQAARFKTGEGHPGAHYVERKEISVGDPELAADMFLNLVLGHAPKTMGRLLRYPRTREATEKRVQAAVRLFLEGVRVR